MVPLAVSGSPAASAAAATAAAAEGHEPATTARDQPPRPQQKDAARGGSPGPQPAALPVLAVRLPTTPAPAPESARAAQALGESDAGGSDGAGAIVDAASGHPRPDSDESVEAADPSGGQPAGPLAGPLARTQIVQPGPRRDLVPLTGNDRPNDTACGGADVVTPDPCRRSPRSTRLCALVCLKISHQCRLGRAASCAQWAGFQLGSKGRRCPGARESYRRSTSPLAARSSVIVFNYW